MYNYHCTIGSWHYKTEAFFYFLLLLLAEGIREMINRTQSPRDERQ